MARPRAIIIGAGPAGLTAALELLRRTDFVPVVLDVGTEVGGLASTRVYRGNRIDIGGHRFFTKSSRVLDWWLELLPLERGADRLRYRGEEHELEGPSEAPVGDRVMMVRERRSRILYGGDLYRYPLRLDRETLAQLGLRRAAHMGASYVRAAASPRPERTLEDFFINRFGRELYATFFRSYTEKVWGVPCAQISAEWGAQRVKGLDAWGVLRHEARRLLGRDSGGLVQAGVETSLIEQFLYPRLGPGQLWEEAARRIEQAGGRILLGERVMGLSRKGDRVTSVKSENVRSGRIRSHKADLVFSTTSIQELVFMLDQAPPEGVGRVARGLVYRDFITVGVLVDRLRLAESARGVPLRDNWIYVHEPGVRVGRIQIFNNWSPWMVADERKVWIGLEYFCNRGDSLWCLEDAAMLGLASEELVRLGAATRGDIRDGMVLRVPRTYPAYFGTYDQLPVVRAYLEQLENLFLVGRNGMHRYNNQDHSMLTAMTAVDNIVAGQTDRSNLWAINTETDYHEAGRAQS